MKKKIKMQFLGIVAMAILLTLVMSAAAFYELFRQEVLDDLKIYAHVLVGTGCLEEPEDGGYVTKTDDIRVTVIHRDGSVLYDSNAQIADMDNHGGRPEVESAFQKGEGSIVRRSKTLDKSTFYYAVRMDNGFVLRAAKETGSIYSVFFSAFPMIVVMAAVMFGICVLLGNILSKSIVRPIEQMANDMARLENVSTYEELQPFINTIQKQHDDILKNARIRQEFTANVSHELKTPLTAISGYSELIENGMASEADVVRFATQIHKSAKRLLSLINDIIRLSELDVMDRNTVSFEEVDLTQIAADCVSMLLLNAEKHEVSIAVQGDACQILANRGMMEELVYNLCDNAIRYNKQGGKVLVSVNNEADGAVVLAVEDTGIGISKEHQERIFERFYRVDKSRSKSTGGTGLGLAIVKHIVMQHDARIVLNSVKGAGTRVEIWFGGLRGI